MAIKDLITKVLNEGVEVSTSNYEFTHGKKPSGTGGWAFDFKVKGEWVTEFCPGQKKYSEAKAWAIKRAEELGAYQVRTAT